MHTYFFQADIGGPIKIGKAIDWKARLGSCQTGNPCKIRCLGIIAGDVEAELHEKFCALRLNGEWFKFHADLVRYIREHAEPIHEPVKLSCPSGLKLLITQWQRETVGIWVPERCADTVLRELELVTGGHFVEAIEHLPIYGLLWRAEHQMLCLCVRWPTQPEHREHLLETLLDAYDPCDECGISLNAYLVDPSGVYENAKVMQRFYERQDRLATGGAV